LRKTFFFEKKNQKTFGPETGALSTPVAQIGKSFLLLFFKKEDLAFFMRLAASCLASLCLYLLAFTLVLDRPLSLGVLRLEIQQKANRLATLPDPKLVILAGSNGPYSHSCAVIGAMLNLPCENAGIAVGIGLDFLARRYAASLHRGDILYMPMEFAQYDVTRGETDAGADGAILLRHERLLLITMPADRVLAAAFSGSFTNFLESAIEMPMARVISARTTLASEYNPQGDRIHDGLASARTALLSVDEAPESGVLARQYGARLIAAFVRREASAGVVVIGGLPTGFASAAPAAATVASVQALYLGNGGMFVALPNLSRYPPADFYDSPDHLAQPCQFRHSIALARALGAVLHRPVKAPDAAVLALAATCPG
jgi:hypothetical protein